MKWYFCFVQSGQSTMKWSIYTFHFLCHWQRSLTSMVATPLIHELKVVNKLFCEFWQWSFYELTQPWSDAFLSFSHNGFANCHMNIPYQKRCVKRFTLGSFFLNIWRGWLIFIISFVIKLVFMMSSHFHESFCCYCCHYY